jgi:phosphatidylserine/phosphatidylglycerophosphate/cardiolipin synthase-like enzyme
MTERIVTNIGPTKFAERIRSLLLDSLSATGGEMWIISPWLTDVDLSVSEAGHFASALGGSRERVSLSELLRHTAERFDVHVVTRPPHQLVRTSLLMRLQEKCTVYQRAKESKSARQDPTYEDIMAALLDEIEYLADEVVKHISTLRCASNFLDAGADLLYRPSLHAKLFWTPFGAMVGSANLTYSGLFQNPELVLETSTDEQIENLQRAAYDLAEGAEPRDDYEFYNLENINLQSEVLDAIPSAHRRKVESLAPLLNRLSGPRAN